MIDLDKKLAPQTSNAYMLLRTIAGALFAFHGMQKVLGILGESAPVMSQLWIGGVVELGAGSLLVLGLFTRWAAFLASGTMAVAYIQFHWDFFAASPWPAENGGELAVVYSFLFLYIACQGRTTSSA